MRAVDGAGVGVRVVGFDTLGAKERPVLNVPYLLASGASDKPVDATAVESLVCKRCVESVASSSEFRAGEYETRGLPRANNRGISTRTRNVGKARCTSDTTLSGSGFACELCTKVSV